MEHAELIELKNRVDATVRAELEKRLTKARIEAIHKELDIAIRELAKEVIAKRKVEIRQRLEKWLADNTESRIETIAKQMLDEALGEVKRRVLGRG